MKQFSLVAFIPTLVNIFYFKILLMLLVLLFYTEQPYMAS